MEREHMIALFYAPFVKDSEISNISERTMSAINKLPLHGIKILDLTRVLAGKDTCVRLGWNNFDVFLRTFCEYDIS
jgi:hypothetical protein